MTTENQTTADLTAAALNVREVGTNPFVITPEGYRVADLENMLPTPTRKRGNATMNDAGSFIAYVNSEEGEGTRLYGTLNPPHFTAVLNDSVGGTIGWGDHKVNYACPLSIEWKTWTGQSGKQMNQEGFAQFIENNLPDIAVPPAADMLEISRSLEAKKKVNFASGVRLSNGQNELVYEEQISGTAAKGKLSVPEEFTIGIPVLEGGERYAVTARLRYRIQEGGKLAMWFELVRPHKIVEDAASAVWKAIEEGTGHTIFNGSANR